MSMVKMMVKMQIGLGNVDANLFSATSVDGKTIITRHSDFPLEPLNITQDDGLTPYLQASDALQHQEQQDQSIAPPWWKALPAALEEEGNRRQAKRCGDCGTKLAGIPALRPRQYATVSRPKKTVQRAYGGSRCANCVQDRIVRAFLIEEQKVVKKVLKESQQKKR
ncbi:hypothetical protein LEMA_P067550.1 [Plenodomus lingam JN3]|uniref:60S ribosomal protein L34 n=1 Tax=Leptosphaeria maculans (strain JN3 / isolate v23.1.3 / race Av1-4-5-6-7-8) TaxID=985895 RepID=E4ZIX7_LEPMJ|nr:hypothetical protein LEMA_P067550.1 [Plenodomus lingam JN3]CBX91247.1 hypothetical protein LEMA_P067550.1 [Plenodomus lingam JN3]